MALDGPGIFVEGNQVSLTSEPPMTSQVRSKKKVERLQRGPLDRVSIQNIDHTEKPTNGHLSFRHSSASFLAFIYPESGQVRSFEVTRSIL